MEDDLIFFINWKQPQYSGKLKTISILENGRQEYNPYHLFQDDNFKFLIQEIKKSGKPITCAVQGANLYTLALTKLGLA